MAKLQYKKILHENLNVEVIKIKNDDTTFGTLYNKGTIIFDNESNNLYLAIDIVKPYHNIHTASLILISSSSAITKVEFIVVAPGGENTFQLPFTLTTNSLVLVEGVALLNSQLSGFDTTIMIINYPVQQGQTVIVIDNVF